MSGPERRLRRFIRRLNFNLHLLLILLGLQLISASKAERRKP